MEGLRWVRGPACWFPWQLPKKRLVVEGMGVLPILTTATKENGQGDLFKVSGLTKSRQAILKMRHLRCNISGPTGAIMLRLNQRTWSPSLHAHCLQWTCTLGASNGFKSTRLVWMLRNH